MAKRSSVSTFNKVLQSVPSEAEFEIAMNGDSTTEVWTDIDTNITDGQAWVIYGMEYCFENIDPTVPLAPSITTGISRVLQIHRNDDSEILLNSNDDDLLMQHRWAFKVNTTGASEGEVVWRTQKLTITMQPTLRVLFRTAADDTVISLTTVQLAGKLYYDKIAAPNIGISKLGSIADL